VLASVLFVGVAAFVQARRDGWGRQVRFLAAAITLPAAYQLFRMGYFGELVANTAIAKEGTSRRPIRGLRYLHDFVQTYWFWFPAVILAAVGYWPHLRALRGRFRREDAVVLVFGAVALVETTYVVIVGGDYLHARLLLPATFALCAPVSVIAATRTHALALAIVPWAIVCLLFLRADGRFTSDWFFNPTTESGVTLDELGFGPGGRHIAWYTGPAIYAQAGPTELEAVEGGGRPAVKAPAAAIKTLGRYSYAVGNDVYILDVHNLAGVVGSHMRIQTSNGKLPLPGHEKPLPKAWIAAILYRTGTPDPTTLPEVAIPLVREVTGPAFAHQVALARETLQCPALERLRQSSGGHLTPRRFLRNVVDSFGNTFLRFSPAPATAQRELCGAAALRPVKPAMPFDMRTGPKPTPGEVHLHRTARRVTDVGRMTTLDPEQRWTCALSGFI
jgi:arabinofuranosyltransferase